MCEDTEFTTRRSQSYFSHGKIIPYMVGQFVDGNVSNDNRDSDRGRMFKHSKSENGAWLSPKQRTNQKEGQKSCLKCSKMS